MSTYRYWPKRQRSLVPLAVIALLTTAVVAMKSSSAVAVTAHQCGPNDANRAHLTLSTGEPISPCLARVNLNLHIAAGGFGFSVARIRALGTTTLTYADGSTEANIVHVAFDRFVINARAHLQTSPMFTGAPNYTLDITPQGPASIGGINDTGQPMRTDAWVTADSTVAVSVIACIQATAGLFQTLSWLLNGTNWQGCWMNLDVRYLVSYNPNVGTTFDDPVRLPDTTVTLQ